MATALYNRYRPRTFSEVVGQTQVTDALVQALRSGRTHHAYLFSGPRGCGKTSSARILAASLNCIHGPTPEPCGVCEQCVAIRAGSSVDVVEIDAASHGLVEDTRDLRERAAFMPASGRYRVFVIDEAHMITPQGFNALLKIVEEPPEFVIFVFATTDPDKVLPTIKSRTFHYQFGLVPPRELEAHLARICGEEGVTVEPAVLPLVVRVAEGSVRDSLSVLDQLLAGSAESGLTYALAVARLGLTDSLLLDEMVDGLARRDAAAVFGVVQRVVEAGQDPRRFTQDLLERLRDLVLLESIPDAPDRGMLDLCPPDQVDRMRLQAARLGSVELSRAADVTHAALVDMRGTTSPRLVLELLCARVLLPAATGDSAALLVRLDRLERRLQAGSTVAASPPPPVVPTQEPRPVAPSPGASEGGGRAPDLPSPAVPSAPVAAPVPSNAAAQAPVPQAASAPSPPPPVAPQPAAPPAPVLAAAPSGDVDVAALRQLWPQVLDRVKGMSRTAHALLVPHADVAGVEGSTVSLAYVNASIGRNFFAHGGAHAEVVARAIADILGGTWRVVQSAPVATPAGAGAGGSSSAPRWGSDPVPPAAAAGSPVAGIAAPGSGGAVVDGHTSPWDRPVSAGFAPGDEPADDQEETEEAVDGPPVLRGEDLAVELLRSHMGATVVGEVDNG